MVPSRQGHGLYQLKDSEDTENRAWRLKQDLKFGHQQAGVVDAIVFPELALSEPQYDVAEQIAFEARCILHLRLAPGG